MLIDILDSNSYLSVNVNLINILGLHPAVYCAALFPIVKKAVTHNKTFEEEYIVVDREYIEKRTGITPEEQLVIEDAWAKGDLIFKHPKRPNAFSFNSLAFIKLITSSNILDEKELSTLKKKVKPKTKGVEAASKRAKACAILKNSIIDEVSDVELKMKEWVDTIFANPRKILTKEIIAVFKSTLDNYAKDDINKKLAIIQIAINQGYTDASWAITSYERNNNISSGALPVRTTAQEKASKLDFINGEKF